MAEYKISGVWKNNEGIITHYAMHTRTATGHTRAVKVLKSEAVRILNNSINVAYTWLWNYSRSSWSVGGVVHVVDGRFLRSNHDNEVRDNLDHLINCNWFIE